ncbi:MAG: hypothetical protein RSC91_09815, partial [Clostridia bacterium]
LPFLLRRKYGIDPIPVRGFVRSKIWFGFKTDAINVKRVLAVAKERALPLVELFVSAFFVLFWLLATMVMNGSRGKYRFVTL